MNDVKAKIMSSLDHFPGPSVEVKVINQDELVVMEAVYAIV